MKSHELPHPVESIAGHYHSYTSTSCSATGSPWCLQKRRHRRDGRCEDCDTTCRCNTPRPWSGGVDLPSNLFVSWAKFQGSYILYILNGKIDDHQLMDTHHAIGRSSVSMVHCSIAMSIYRRVFPQWTIELVINTINHAYSMASFFGNTWNNHGDSPYKTIEFSRFTPIHTGKSWDIRHGPTLWMGEYGGEVWKRPMAHAGGAFKQT